MINFSRIVIPSAALMFSWSAFGQGTLAFHSGAIDPTTEGFNLIEEQPASVGSVFSDQGTEAWLTYCDETSNVFAKAYYQQIFTGQQTAELNDSDWSLAVTVGTALNIGLSSSVVVNTGTELFLLGFHNITSGNVISVQGSTAQSVLISGGTSSYHTYRLNYRAATDSADLYFDGTDILNNITGASLGFPGKGALTWGEISSGEANWNLVSLTTIPEPSSFGLAVLSCFCGLLYVTMKLHDEKHAFDKPSA